MIDVCTSVEDRITEHLAELMLARIEALAESAGIRFRAVAPRTFYFGTATYEVRITEHPTDPATIQFAIVKTSVPLDRSVRTPLTLSFDASGRYSMATLYVHDDLRKTEELIAGDIEAAYVTGYRWLEAHVRGELLAVEHRLAIELYMEVRSVLTPALANAVGLYGVFGNKAIYLLDPTAILTAYTRALERQTNVTASPLELTALLVTQMLDPDETISKVSLTENRRVALDLADSPYASTRLDVVERIYYQSEGLMHFPLVRDGKLRVTAAYPTNMDAQISPALKQIADRCAEIVRAQAKFVRLRAFGPHNEGLALEILETLAKLGGYYTGGFVDSQK